MLTENPPINVLMIAPPGMMRDSLCSLLSSIPAVSIVGFLSFEDQIPQSLVALYPDIVLMDCTGKAHNLETIRRIKVWNPDQYCLVIAGNSHEARLAYLYGADEVLTHGYTGFQFKAALRKYGYIYPQPPNQRDGGEKISGATHIGSALHLPRKR